jgi:hypothetical protein
MQQQTHAEMLVSQLLSHYHYEPELIPFYFFRVRSNGLLADKDFKPKWKKHTIPSCDSEMFLPFERRADEALPAERGGDEEEEEEEVRQDRMREERESEHEKGPGGAGED